MQNYTNKEIWDLCEQAANNAELADKECMVLAILPVEDSTFNVIIQDQFGRIYSCDVYTGGGPASGAATWPARPATEIACQLDDMFGHIRQQMVRMTNWMNSYN